MSGEIKAIYYKDCPLFIIRNSKASVAKVANTQLPQEYKDIFDKITPIFEDLKLEFVEFDMDNPKECE